MKAKSNLLLAVLLIPVLFIGGCASTERTGAITQVSTLDAIVAGAYDGKMKCGELTTFGDMGIGTFHALDGEMVLLNGKVYQVKDDGKVCRPDGEMRTPFAAVVPFRADYALTVPPGTGFKGFEQLVDGSLPDSNVPYAIKAHGRFKRMRTRSVPAQVKPYPPLVEVTKHQPEFSMEDVDGTVVGFRLPVYIKGINMPGYHLHFLSDDERSGGHILDFEFVGGTVEVDGCHRFTLILPAGGSDFGKVDFTKDRSRDLEKSEKRQ